MKGLEMLINTLEHKLQRALDEATIKVANDISNNVPKRTGALSASIAYQTSTSTNMLGALSAPISINPSVRTATPTFFKAPHTNYIWSTIDYAKWVEVGTGTQSGKFIFSRTLQQNVPYILVKLANAI